MGEQLADLNEAMQPRKSGGKNPAKGTSALILAVENGHFELALELVKAGADPNLTNEMGISPLSLAVANGSSAMAEVLLRNGADPSLEFWHRDCHRKAVGSEQCAVGRRQETD